MGSVCFLQGEILNMKSMKIQFPFSIRFLPVLLLSALMLQCPGDAPVQELGDAKGQIEKAESVGAAEFAADQLAEAKQSLVDAHKFLEEKKNRDAKKSALAATETALRAGEQSAPLQAAAMKEQADSALQGAGALHAEEISKEKYEAAARSFEEGKALLAEADEKKGEAKGADVAARNQNIDRYAAAIRKFTEARDVATELKEAAGQSKEELIARADNIESILRRAKEHGAEEFAKEDYAKGRGELATGITDLNDGKLDAARNHLTDAEKYATSALMTTLSSQAQEKYDTATKEVEGSRSLYEPQREHFSDHYRALLDDYMKAADEALTSSKGNLDGKEYENSIKDSKEAVNLARVIQEQIADIEKEASVARGRGGVNVEEEKQTVVTTPPPVKTKEVKKSAKTEEAPTGGWKRYTVKNRKPSDCLWRIARMQQHYGKKNGKLWRRIYDANRNQIKNPNLIHPGMVLMIPPRTGPVTQPKRESPEEPTPGMESKQGIPATEPTTEETPDDQNSGDTPPDGDTKVYSDPNPPKE